MSVRALLLSLSLSLPLLVMASGCSSAKPRPASLLASEDPAQLHADYAIFERRCSKCHALSRALESGFETDAKWVAYVTRMRRQPASGITVTDAEAILRYLHVRVRRQRDAKAEAEK